MCGDKTTWVYGGMGDQSSGIMNRAKWKPNITTVDQITLVTDVRNIRPRDYLHRQKLNENKPPFKKEVPNEMWTIFD